MRSHNLITVLVGTQLKSTYFLYNNYKTVQVSVSDSTLSL